MSAAGGMINSANILGGEGIVENEESRTLAEVGFGQINVVDLFQMRQYVLHTIKYGSELVKPVSDDLGSYIYQVKAHSGDVYYLGLLITPYSDINLTTYEEYVDLTCKYFAGSYRRSEAQKSTSGIDLASDYEGADQTAKDMLSLQHHLLFERREMRGGVESLRKPVNLFMVLLSEIEIILPYYQCSMDGCKKESKKEDLKEGKCPYCGSEARYVPPTPTITKVAFVFPKSVLGVTHPDYQRPMDMVSILQLGIIPEAVLVAINEVNKEIFSNIVYLPERAIYEFRDCDDLFETRSIWRREGTKLIIATSMSDSLDIFPDAIPQMEGRTLLRDLTEGIEKGQDFDDILPRTIVKDWLRSDWFSMQDLGELSELQSYGGLLGMTEDEVAEARSEFVPSDDFGEDSETGDNKEEKGRFSKMFSRGDDE